MILKPQALFVFYVLQQVSRKNILRWICVSLSGSPLPSYYLPLSSSLARSPSLPLSLCHFLHLTLNLLLRYSLYLFLLLSLSLSVPLSLSLSRSLSLSLSLSRSRSCSRSRSLSLSMKTIMALIAVDYETKSDNIKLLHAELLHLSPDSFLKMYQTASFLFLCVCV